MRLFFCSLILFPKRIRFPFNSQTRFPTRECPALFPFLKGRTLIPHPSSNAFRTGIYFEVAQEFLTSFWIVGKNGHSNSTVLGLPYQKQQLPAKLYFIALTCHWWQKAELHRIRRTKSPGRPILKDASTLQL